MPIPAAIQTCGFFACAEASKRSLHTHALAFPDRARHARGQVTQGRDGYPQTSIISRCRTDREGMWLCHTCPGKRKKRELARAVPKRTRCRCHLQRNRVTLTRNRCNPVLTRGPQLARSRGVGVGNRAQRADRQHVGAERVPHREGFQDEHKVECTQYEERPDQAMRPFPEVIRDERCNRDHHQDQKPVQADFARSFGNLNQHGLAPRPTHLGIDGIVQQNGNHGTDAQPFVHPVSLIKRAKNRFDPWPSRRNDLRDGHCDKR